MTTTAPLNLAATYLRLKADGSAEQLPVTAEFWPALAAGELGDFRNEYLVTLLTFTENWSSWERHPHGDEVVVMLSGAIDFVLDAADGEHTVQLRRPGEYAFVAKNTWHTANIIEPTAMLFITAGEGTEGKPRF